MSNEDKPWTHLLSVMKSDGELVRPKKRQATAKPAPSAPDWRVVPIPEGYFDISKHGYWRSRGQLVYKTPDGRTLPATGVDNFGPFPEYKVMSKFLKH